MKKLRFEMVQEILVIEPGRKGRQCVMVVQSLRSRPGQVGFGLWLSFLSDW